MHENVGEVLGPRQKVIAPGAMLSLLTTPRSSPPPAHSMGTRPSRNAWMLEVPEVNCPLFTPLAEAKRPSGGSLPSHESKANRGPAA
ncbi:hypothetical protein PGT21_021172 [Puccinia graminis f. sp. tritici]|uniref:Uncharacterized protein n=1 Tax=Puccinia graminis f. sp. tritici TaxID=56615 RepID=A0A5B0LUX3_PUCGR|nr:hypothetical protein PGT21_021172 [Puccinia graminis f. sp. tritici]KAA1091746.1 hypothetical protein PGTUg99_010001 [Puccinia graminis f. sp. tritici]